MSEHVAIVHIGTHKTGTTSLQVFFEANKEALRTSGVRVAQGGRYNTLPGNHQVAWELLTSNLSPHFDDLLTELRDTRERAVLISSEDFSLLYARPEALGLLRDGIRAAGFSPKIVVFVRSQAPYAESMYVERIKHDYVRPLGGYLETILRDGLYVPDGSPIHLEFEYTRLLEPFVRTFGKTNVIVRPYIPSSDPLTIFREFLAVVVSLDSSLLQTTSPLQVPQARANESLTFLGLVEAAHGACHAQVLTGQSALESIREIAPDVTDEILNSRVRLLARSESLAFRARFAEDNERLHTLFDVRLHDAGGADIPSSSDAVWDQARAQRRIFDRLIDGWSRKTIEFPQRPE